MSEPYPQLSDLGDPVFENVPHNPHRSFHWHAHGYPDRLAKWNFHPEYEFHLIHSSHGHYVVGDYVGRFGPGNLTLIGPNLPHCWYSDLAHDSQVIRHRDVLVQFRDEWFESLMQVCPELDCIKTLLKDSERGILFTAADVTYVEQRMKAMGAMQGWERVATLIELLGYLSHTDYRPITSKHYRLRHVGVHSEQVDAVLRYLHRNFNEPIRMAEIADWQGMPLSTFSRFFKQVTGDTFTTFLRRLRIDHACRLLHDPEHSVAEICFMAGYGNISNFNRHFKHLTGMTPREYRQNLAPVLAQGVQEFQTT